MNRTILGVAALFAAAVALAGCGGSTSVHGTTGGSAGAHHGKASGKAAANFRATVHGFEARLQTGVKGFESGNLAKAASARSLLTSCSTVETKLSSEATTHAQMQSVAHLRTSCSDMSKATNAGLSGNLTKAKKLARTALTQAQTAARLSG